jgi:hypothetical protein
MSNSFVKMMLISEDEYNTLRTPTMLTAPFYTAPDKRQEQRDFKHLGEGLENRGKQLFDSVIRYSRVNDKNEWYEKRDDPLPVSGTNIVDLISYAIKTPAAHDTVPYGWNVFVEFLKKTKAVPRSLLHKRVQDLLKADKVFEAPQVSYALDYVDPEPSPAVAPLPLAAPVDATTVPVHRKRGKRVAAQPLNLTPAPATPIPDKRVLATTQPHSITPRNRRPPKRMGSSYARIMAKKEAERKKKKKKNKKKSEREKDEEDDDDDDERENDENVASLFDQLGEGKRRKINQLGGLKAYFR